MSSADHRERRRLLAEARYATAEESQRAMSRPAFWPGGAWLILGLAVVGGLISGPLLGARALIGGGLLPLDATIEGLWAQVRWVQPASVDNLWGAVVIPADPAALLLALLGSLTWWSPSLALVGLWFAAPLLAGLVAWWSAAQFTARSLPTTVFALIWSIQPTFIIALTDGRWTAVLLHIALPWLLATALTAHTSWQRAAIAGFATAVVTALAPILWPAVILGWIVVLLGYGWVSPVRALLGTLPLALLPAVVWWLPRALAPTEIAVLPGLGRYLADPGIVHSTGEPVGSQWWWYALGWPVSPPVAEIAGLRLDMTILAAVLAAPIIVTALAVFATSRSAIQVVFGVLFGAGLITAVVAPSISQGFLGAEQVGVWPGSAVALMMLAVVAAATATLDELSPEAWEWGATVTAKRVAAASAGVIIFVTTGLASIGIAQGLWSEPAPVNAQSQARTLPALVAAEASENPQQGTLIITEGAQAGQFSARIERGQGATLNDTNTLYRFRPTDTTLAQAERAQLVASLVQPTSANAGALLVENNIRFVAFRGDTTSDAALAMGQRPYLVASGETDTAALWAVDGVNPRSVETVSPTPSQTAMDMAWWVVWALCGVLALPTERRPRRRLEDDDDSSSLPKALEETTHD